MILILAFCPSLIFLIILTIWRKRQMKKGKPPFTDNFLRSPGESLFSQIQDLSERILMSILELILIPVLIAVLFITAMSGSNKILIVIAIAVYVGFLIYYITKILKLIKERRLLRLGYDGEVAAGQELNQLMLDGYNVYHDFPADKFNIDHIIVGSDAVYAVETKARSKPMHRSHRDNYKVISDGKTLQFHDYSSSESINQAERQAKWLQKWLSSAVGEHVTVKPILLFPGWNVERSKPDGVPVFNPKVVRQYLSNKEKTLSQSLRTRIVHQLDQKCRDIEPKTVQIENQ
jgi:hypothetical protein